MPFAAGGGTDITARVIAQWLSERLGQQFVVENRPGGGTNIGTEAATKAPPDGYTLLMVGTSNVINPTLYDKLNFNFIRDIAPIAGVIRAPFVLDVNPSIPVRTVPEFIAYAKANPRQGEHGVFRQRLGVAHDGRVVQDDGRRRHAARAVSRRRRRRCSI